MRRSVERARVNREPYLLWNAFIDLVATEKYANLTPLQRRAHLVFWYDSEVQNGGHGQYLENRGLEQLVETVNALAELGLPCHAQVLSRATTKLSGGEQDAGWVDVLPDGFIEELDDAFHDCTPSVSKALEQHLATYSAEYVELT